jgi:predicted enzyme related to lactoylglutathione lyase
MLEPPGKRSRARTTALPNYVGRIEIRFLLVLLVLHKTLGQGGRRLFTYIPGGFSDFRKPVWHSPWRWSLERPGAHAIVSTAKFAVKWKTLSRTPLLRGGIDMTAEFNPVGWFEIPVTDMARAKAFYEHVFATRLELHDLGPLQMAWFPMHPAAKGASGSLVRYESYTPSHHGALIYFTVTDIDAALMRVTSKGGKVLQPKKSIGEHGFVGHFEDSEGNRVAVHSRNG